MRSELKQQKARFLAEAWKSLPPKLVQQVKNRHAVDAEMFQFEDPGFS
jgi:hypothetical protein